MKHIKWGNALRVCLKNLMEPFSRIAKELFDYFAIIPMLPNFLLFSHDLCPVFGSN